MDCHFGCGPCSPKRYPGSVVGVIPPGPTAGHWPGADVLALATAHEPPQYEPLYTTNAAGVQNVTSYVLAKADIPGPGEVPLGQRLMIAAALIVTIWVHGGAAVSVGLGLTTADRWSRRAVVVAVGLTVLVVFLLPLYLFLLDNSYALATAMWSFVMASDSLLALLVNRRSFTAGETLWSVMFWDVVVTLLAVGLSWWTIWVWQRRLSGVSKAKASLASDLHDGQPAVATALVSE